MCVSPKPMKGVPERVCHASIVRLIRHGRGRGKKSGSLAFYFGYGRIWRGQNVTLLVALMPVPLMPPSCPTARKFASRSVTISISPIGVFNRSIWIDSGSFRMQVKRNGRGAPLLQYRQNSARLGFVDRLVHVRSRSLCRRRLYCKPMVAQFGIEGLPAFFGKEYPRPFKLYPPSCPRNVL